MALEATFRGLADEMKKLQDNLFALHLTVSEDKPQNGEVALVDQFDDTIQDTRDLIQKCVEHSGNAQKAIALDLEMDRARRALTKCQESFHLAEKKFSEELVSYEKLRALAILSSRKGGEWSSWANSVKHGMEQCRHPLDLASKALALCWQEIAEHAGATSISLRATNIGQKIIAKNPDDEKHMRHGIA